MASRHYCCYFDHRYAPRALAMLRSLRRFDPDCLVWVLCLNDVCHEIMTAIAEPGVRLISMTEFEAGDDALLAARENRSLIEYYFTCTPSLIQFVLRRCSAGQTVTYVDGDLYFFTSPLCLHEELGNNSVSLIPHRFPESQRQREIYGLYNVGWLTFRNDPNGLAVVSWWRDRCNEWCFDRLEGERFADQKYLDRVPQMFPGVVVIRHPGANVAPWNLARYHPVNRNGVIEVVEGVPLVFFHFHGIKATRWCYLLGLRQYGASLEPVTRRDLYRPYLAQVAQIERALQDRQRELVAPRQVALLQRGGVQNRPRGWQDGLRRTARSVVAAVRQDALIVIAGRLI
jgi:hypothetical protein